MMEFNESVYYIEKRGSLKGLSDAEKIDFIEICKSHFYFYDPYNDLLFNPITSKTSGLKTLQALFLHSKTSLEEKLDSELPSQETVEKAFEILYRRKEKGNTLESIIGAFKYIGLIMGGLLTYFVDYRLGLAVGLYLIYFDYNSFDKINRLIDRIQNGIITAPLWNQRRSLYFLGSLITLILSLISLYMFTNSIWLVAGIFIAQKVLFFNPIIQFIVSSGFRGTEIAIQLEEEYGKQSKNFEFFVENPKGIKLQDLDFYGAILCEFDELIEHSINYETPDGDVTFRHLFIYSKEPLRVFDVEEILLKEELLHELLRLEKESLVEFYFEHIPNYPKSSYIIIAKESYLSLSHFEGSYSHNIAKSYYDNGNMSDYNEYVYGTKHGLEKRYFENGYLHFECSFKNGFLIPDYYLWKYEDGKTCMRGALRVVNDLNPEEEDLYNPNSQHRIGVWELFDKDGSLIKSVNYLDIGEKKIISENTEKSGNYFWL